MLCAKYDYNMDIAVKKEEAYQDGHEAGRTEKALESAANLLKKEVPVETIAECIGLPLEKVLELKQQIIVNA